MTLKRSIRPEYQTCMISDFVEVAPGVRSLILQSEQPLLYRAGQFITFAFEGIEGELRRSYSFSTAPSVDEQVAITIGRVDNGRVSRPLIDGSVRGLELSVASIGGQFVLPEPTGSSISLVFFAAGLGITPIFSLLREALYTRADIQVLLVYSNASELRSLFLKDIKDLQRDHAERFNAEYLFSNDRNLSVARLNKHLLPQILQRSTMERKGAGEILFYTCGPAAYMRMVRMSLIEQGYSASQIRKELFDTSAPAVFHAPPDRDRHSVKIVLSKRSETISVQYPDTILRAARRSGIALPYSCETGRCGSCAMRCTSGKVWMSNNEVLTPTDLEEGRILTCVGYPIGGDITIEWS